MNVLRLSGLLAVCLALATLVVWLPTVAYSDRGNREFGATLMIAGNIPGRTQTVSIAIYEAVNAGDDALAGALVLIVSIVCVTLLIAANLFTRRGHMRVAPI